MEHIDIINLLNNQICAILDLMMLTEDGVDIQSIKTASEMALTMQDELMIEVRKLEELLIGDKNDQLREDDLR